MRLKSLFLLLSLIAMLLIPVQAQAASASGSGTEQKAVQQNAASGEEKKKEIPTKAIEIEGLKALDPDDVYKILGVKVKSWFAFWKSDEKRIPVSLIPAIGDSLRGYLDSKGYYDATYTIKNLPGKVIITIHEGKPVIVSDINVSSDFPIQDEITFDKGDPFETEKFSTIKSKIKSALLKEGYCSYDLDTKAYVDLDKRSVDLVYRLKKGDLCHFGNTTVVEKPKEIRDAVILSRMRYRPGDLFTTERVNESYAALNGLGIFGQTLIDTDKKYFNVIRPEVHAKLKEKMRRYTISAGYDSVAGFRIKGTYDHYNLFGGGRKGGLVAQYSSDIKELSANFFQPAILQYGDQLYADLYLNGGYYEEAFDDYNSKKIFFDMKLRHEEGFWSYDLGASIERIRIELVNDTDEIIPGNFNLVYGYGTLAYDARDSKLNPRNGYYLKGYLEYGYSMGAEENNPYYKFLLEGHYIKSFGKLTLATVGHLGILDDGGAAALPASKYFYAGGSYSNRAYAERDIGITYAPTDDGALGGRTWLNFTAEAQYPIWGELYGGVFYDATMLSEDYYDFSYAWVQSAGVGVRYMTPMGPIKLDFAANIHDPSINRISIMIGQSF